MCYKRLNRAQKDAEHQIFDTTKKKKLDEQTLMDN